MECPNCKAQINDNDLFCNDCGEKLFDILKDNVISEILVGFGEVGEQSKEKTDTLLLSRVDRKVASPDNNIGFNHNEEYIQKKDEYKRLLRKVFEDRTVSGEEQRIIFLNAKKLGLDKEDVVILRSEVESELGFEIDDLGDLSADIILETNENRIHIGGESSNIEFGIRNISGNDLNAVSIFGYLQNLEQKRDIRIGKINSQQRHINRLPFFSPHAGNERIEIIIEYTDHEGNPYVYRSNIPIKLTAKMEEKGTQFNFGDISIGSGKVIGGVFDKFINIQIDKNKNQEMASSVDDLEKKWVRRGIFFEENETARKRIEIKINSLIKEGESKLREGMDQKVYYEFMGKSKKEALPDLQINAIRSFEAAESCFMKVCELNCEHEGAYEKIKYIKTMILEINSLQETLVANKDNCYKPDISISAVCIKNACLTFTENNKKIYLYNKNKIVMGRDSNNDVVLRIVPYHPKEKYQENWKKTADISSVHAEIIHSEGEFLIRDIGSDNKGSKNGTFVNGNKLQPLSGTLLRNHSKISIAKSLDMEAIFLGDGNNTNGLKLRRINNLSEEEYMLFFREVNIGRKRENIVCINRKTVSDMHVIIRYRDNQYWIEDLGSENGTWVNGNRIQPGEEAALGNISDISLGDVKVNFRCGQENG